MTAYALTLRLAAALVVGTVIGIERQWRHKLAGLRTTVLVAVGAAVFCLIAALSDHEASPTRIAAQVASGIGFLCGGIILRDGLQVCGLNTAASLWCAAAGGAMAGSGFLLPAVAVSLLILGTNLFLRQLTSMFEAFENTRLRQEVRYEMQILYEEHVLQHVRVVVRTTVRESSLIVLSIRSTMLTTGRQFQIVTELAAAERADFDIEHLTTTLSMEEGISSVAWQCTADPHQRADLGGVFSR